MAILVPGAVITVIGFPTAILMAILVPGGLVFPSLLVVPEGKGFLARGPALALSLALLAAFASLARFLFLVVLLTLRGPIMGGLPGATLGSAGLCVIPGVPLISVFPGPPSFLSLVPG